MTVGCGGRPFESGRFARDKPLQFRFFGALLQAVLAREELLQGSRG